MGRIEISDGVSARTIPTAGLPHSIRIEVGSGDRPRVIVPEGVSVERLEPAE